METNIQTGLIALGDPSRLAIFHALAAGPHAVNELAAGLPISRPAVSQHLRVLKEARLVRDRRAGAKRIYEIDPAGIAMLRDHFSELWDQTLSAFKKFAEDEYKKEKKNAVRDRTKSLRTKDDSGGRAH